jgi:hypothetical protein
MTLQGRDGEGDERIQFSNNVEFVIPGSMLRIAPE